MARRVFRRARKGEGRRVGREGEGKMEKGRGGKGWGETYVWHITLRLHAPHVFTS